MNFLESRHVSIRITRLLLYSLLFFFSWTSEGFSYTDELYQAVYAVANPGITPTTRQQALVFKYNRTINKMRLNDDIPNAVFIKNQEFFDSLNSNFSLESAEQNGLNLAVQQKDPNAIPKAGTDTDNLLSRGKSGNYITPEQARNVKKTYNQKVKEWLDKMEERDTCYHDWSHETDTDFMVNRSDVASESDFRKISETINAEGGTAYVRGDAANAEAAIRAGDDISFKQANSYIDEMMELSDHKFHEADIWDQRYIELEKTTPKPGTKADIEIEMKMVRGEAHLARAQGGKYIDRINKVNAKLGEQFNIKPTLLDSPGFKALKKAIKREPKTAIQAGQIAALKKQLSQHVAEAYAETLAEIAKSHPHLTKECQKSMAKVLGSLPDGALGDVIDRLRGKFGNRFASGLNKELKVVNAIKQSGLKYNQGGSPKPSINPKGDQPLTDAKKAGNNLVRKKVGEKYKNKNFDDYDLLPNDNDVSKELGEGIKKEVSESKSYKKLMRYKDELDQQMKAKRQRVMARRQEYLKKMSKQQIDDLANLRAIWNKSLTSPFKEAMDGFMLMDAANILVDSLRAWQKDDLSTAISVAGTQTTMLIGTIYLFNTGIKAGQSAGILGPLAWGAIKKEAARRGLHTGAGKLIIHGLEKLGGSTVTVGSAIGSAGAKLLPVLNYYFMAKTIETLAQGSVDLATEHVYGPYRYKKLIALYGDKDEDRSKIKEIRDFEIDDMYSFWEWMKIRGYVTRPSRESLFFVFPSPNALKVAVEMYHDWFKEKYVFAGASKWTTDEELWSSLREMAVQDYFTTAAKQYQEQQKMLEELKQTQIDSANYERTLLKQEKDKKLDMSAPPFQLAIGDITSKDETFYAGLKGRFAVNYVVMGNPGSQVKLEVTATIRSGEKIITEFRLINPGKTDVDFDQEIGEVISFLPVFDMPEEPGSYRLTVEIVGRGLPDKAAEDQKPFSLNATKSIAITVKEIKEKDKDKPTLEDKGEKPEKEKPSEAEVPEEPEVVLEETAEPAQEKPAAPALDIVRPEVRSGRWVDESPDTEYEAEDPDSGTVLKVYPALLGLRGRNIEYEFGLTVALADMELGQCRTARQMSYPSSCYKTGGYYAHRDKLIAKEIQDTTKDLADAERAKSHAIEGIQEETRQVLESGQRGVETWAFLHVTLSPSRKRKLELTNEATKLQVVQCQAELRQYELTQQLGRLGTRQAKNRTKEQEAEQAEQAHARFEEKQRAQAGTEHRNTFEYDPAYPNIGSIVQTMAGELRHSPPYRVTVQAADRPETTVRDNVHLGWDTFACGRNTKQDERKLDLEARIEKLRVSCKRSVLRHSKIRQIFDLNTKIKLTNYKLAIEQANEDMGKITDSETIKDLQQNITRAEEATEGYEEGRKKRWEEIDDEHQNGLRATDRGIADTRDKILKLPEVARKDCQAYLAERNFSDFEASEHLAAFDPTAPIFYTGQFARFTGKVDANWPVQVSIPLYTGVPHGVVPGDPPQLLAERAPVMLRLYHGAEVVATLEFDPPDRKPLVEFVDKERSMWFGRLGHFKERYADLTTYPPENQELRQIHAEVAAVFDDFGWLSGEAFYSRLGLKRKYDATRAFTLSEIQNPSEGSVKQVEGKWNEIYAMANAKMETLRARAEAAWDRFSKDYKVKQDDAEKQEPDLNKVLAALSAVTDKPDDSKSSSSSKPHQTDKYSSRDTSPFKKSSKDFLYGDGDGGTFEGWHKNRDTEIDNNLQEFKDKYARGPDTSEQSTGRSVQRDTQPSAPGHVAGTPSQKPSVTPQDPSGDLQKILDAINREVKGALKAMNFKHDCAEQVKQHFLNVSSLLDKMIAILNSIDVNRDIEAGLRDKIFSWSKDNITSTRDLIIRAKKVERTPMPETGRLNQIKTKNTKKCYRVCTPVFEKHYAKFVKINKLLGGDGKPQQTKATDEYDDTEKKMFEDTERAVRDLEKEYEDSERKIREY